MGMVSWWCVPSGGVTVPSPATPSMPAAGTATFTQALFARKTLLPSVCLSCSSGDGSYAGRKHPAALLNCTHPFSPPKFTVHLVMHKVPVRCWWCPARGPNLNTKAVVYLKVIPWQQIALLQCWSGARHTFSSIYHAL